MRIGIVGVGVVGGAVAKFFTEYGHDVVAYDKDGERSKCESFSQVLDAPVCFVCVPTPTLASGIQDHQPLLSVLHRFNMGDYRGVIAHKCTVLPGTTLGLSKQFPKLRIVHYPEFLTERNAYKDFASSPASLISGSRGDCKEVSKLLGGRCILFRDYASTEIAKYAHNCFLATKVSFMNEMADVCERFGVAYPAMIEGASMMGGIGKNHINVPGPDGKRGWGGMCFPKDTEALLTAMGGLGVLLPTLEGAVITNKKHRWLNETEK